MLKDCDEFITDGVQRDKIKNSFLVYSSNYKIPFRSYFVLYKVFTNMLISLFKIFIFAFIFIFNYKSVLY